MKVNSFIHNITSYVRKISAAPSSQSGEYNEEVNIMILDTNNRLDTKIVMQYDLKMHYDETKNTIYLIPERGREYVFQEPTPDPKACA